MSINLDTFPQDKSEVTNMHEQAGKHFASEIGATALAGSREWTLDGKHPTQVDANYAVQATEIGAISEPKHLKKPEDLNKTLDRIGKIRSKSKPINSKHLS